MLAEKVARSTEARLERLGQVFQAFVELVRIKGAEIKIDSKLNQGLLEAPLSEIIGHFIAAEKANQSMRPEVERIARMLGEHYTLSDYVKLEPGLFPGA
jgi:hypothetical protein